MQPLRNTSENNMMIQTLTQTSTVGFEPSHTIYLHTTSLAGNDVHTSLTIYPSHSTAVHTTSLTGIDIHVHTSSVLDPSLTTAMHTTAQTRIIPTSSLLDPLPTADMHTTSMPLHTTDMTTTPSTTAVTSLPLHTTDTYYITSLVGIDTHTSSIIEPTAHTIDIHKTSSIRSSSQSPSSTTIIVPTPSTTTEAFTTTLYTEQSSSFPQSIMTKYTAVSSSKSTRMSGTLTETPTDSTQTEVSQACDKYYDIHQTEP